MKNEVLARAKTLLSKSGVTSDGLLSHAKNSGSTTESVIVLLCDALEKEMSFGKSDPRVDEDSMKQARKQNAG